MIGGIGNWLKKRVDDVQGAFGVSNTAQTFKTNTPKAAPARTISRQSQPQQFSQPAQTNKITNDVNSVMQPRFNLNQSLQNNGVNTQPKVQQPKTTQQLVNDSYGSGFSGLINRGKDILDPNTEADRIKRQAQSGLNETHEQQQSRLTNTATSAQTNRSIGQQGAASFGREALNFFGKTPGAIGNIVGSIMQSKNPVVKTLRSAVPVLNAASVADAQTGGAGGRELQRMSNNANKFIDNKVGQSRFGERQGENKWAVGGGQVAAQLPLQIATGGAGVVSTGAQMASDEYNKAREAGKSNDAALGIGLLQGGASALSEKIGVDRFLPGNNVAGSTLVRAAKRFLTEGTQEAQQQFTQNLITNKTYNPNQSLREGIGESFLLGGSVGGATSGLLDAPDVFNNRTPLNEGGYIAGPLAPDFSKAQAEGKVFEGVDGKPRFEVDDSGAKIKNPNGKTLGELLDHPKLFEQYDSLKNLPVKTFTDSDSRLSGAYDYENKSMELNLADRNPLGALLHELQHAVQDIEGTATGTSLYRAGEYRNKKLREHNSNLTTEETYKRQEKINQEVDAVKAARRKEGSPLSHDETTALYTKLRNKYFGRPSKYGKLTDFDVYERHAGEAEARAVEARMNMPMSERYVKPETLYHGTGKDFKQFGLNAETKQARADIAKLNAERNKLVDSGKVVDNALTIPPQAQKRIAQIDQEIQAIYQRPNIMPSNVKEKGVYLTSDKNYAKTFAGKDGKILETTADLKKPYIIKNQDEMDLIEDAAYYPDIIKGLEADGYDGIKAPDGQVLVFDPAKVKIGTPQPRSTFYDSLDVPKEDLIVRNEGGKAMSVDPLESLKQEARKLDEQVRSYDMKKNFKGFSESDDARQLVELEGKLQKQNELVSRLENPVDKVTVSQIESVGRKAILKGDVTKEQLVKQYAKMSKEKYPSNQKRYIDDVYGSPEAYFDDVIAKGEAGIVEQYSQFAEMSTSPKFEDFYNRTVLSRNKTGLNRNEPKLNKVERKITETEPKRTEKATQSQPPKAKPSPLESLKQEARKYETAKEFALVHSNEKQRLRLDDLSAVETSDKSVDWGFDQRKAPPIIVDQHGQILDGHHRYYAAKEAFEKDAKLYNEGKVNHTYMEQKWGDVNFGEIDAVVKNKENLGKGWAQEKKSDNLTYDQLTDLYNQAHTEAKTAAPKVEAPKSAPIEKTPLTVYRGEPTKIAGRTFGGNTVIDNTTGLPRTTGGYTGIPTSTNGEYVNKRFGGSLSEVRAFEAKPTAKILSDPQEILRLSGAKSPDSFFNRKSGIAPYNGKKVYVEAKKAGYDAVDLSKIESMLPNKQTIESEVRILNQEAFIDKAKSGAPIEKTPQVGKPDPTAALKQEANQLKTPRGNLQDALQPDTAYSDMLRGIEAQTQQPQVFDPELKKLERQKQQIIDAEARAKYEASKQLAQDQKDLRKTIRASGGIGSSDYETLPSGLKRKNGRALDDLATELGFESDQALVDELTTHTQPERLKDLREVVEHEMKNGKSELSGDYKNLLKAIDDRHAELLRYPDGARVIENKPNFPTLEEFNSLTSRPEAQDPSSKTRSSVAAATSDLRKQQFDAVIKGDLDTADQVRKKIGEIETGLKRTAPEPTVPRGNIVEALAPKPVSFIPRSLNDFDKMIGGTGNIESEVRNDAATMSTVGKDAKALLESIQGDNEVTKAARKAMEDGSEIHYYAKKDANGRSVGIERFNPKNMKIEAGFVTDNDGNVLGNHIKVDDTGIQINVGGNLVNLNSVIGNPLDWQGQYRISETMERNIKRNAPTPEIAEKTQRFLIAAKTKREAQFREELQSVRNEFAQLDKATMAVKPKGVKDKAYRADLMDFFENNMSDQDFKGKYGEAALIQATVAKNKTRSTYDELLDRVNDEFGKFGEKQVDRRKDYITHINELNGRPSFAGELYGRLQNSILGEGSAQNRSGLPGDIAGRTENFEPRKRWNQFFQARKGGEYTKDPFKAIDAYLEPSLYNIHMTEPAVRARAVESAFRTAEQIKNTTTEGLTKQLIDSLARYRDTTGNTKLVKGFQEYANALAGKTQKLDRDIIDMSKSTELGLRGWQSLQGIAGKATILGNINSVVSQTLGLPSAVADAGVKNYAKGIAASISNDGSIKKSPFIKARETNVDSRFRSKTQKVMNVGGIPIQVVELAMVKQTWQAEHAKVKSEGYKGMDAVLEADRRTERVVAGRGIADKPELYRSTAMNGLMEYTLEAEAQFKNFTQDLNPKQKATFIVAAFAMNSLSELVTGNTPLPDFLGAAIDSLGDIFGEDKEGAEKLTSPLQRFASEAVSFNPLVTAGVNALTTKDMRKSLFGEDSNLGRYDGTSAPVQVIKNAYNAVDSAANGEWTNARNEALKDLPFGNQIRKSLTGLEANMRGSAVDKSGEKTFETGKNAGSQLRNFLFGANSTKEAREYYDKPKGSDSKPTGGNLLSTDELLKEQMSSPEQQDFLKLKSDEQKELAKSDPKAKAWLEQIKTTKRINADDVERPEGLSAESKRILEWDNKRTQEQKNRLQYTQNDYDYKLAKAKYEQDKLKGNVSRAEQINRDQSLKKAEIGSQFSKDTREAYNSLTKAELQAYAEQDPNGNQIWNDAVAYGDKLVEAGLLKKNKLRTASKGGGRKGKGGRKGTTAKYKSGAGSSNDISKKLQQLAFGSSKSKSGSSAPKKHAAKLKGVRSA